jgi:RNA polymerase sigma-70 factor (ECF subfamily)
MDVLVSRAGGVNLLDGQTASDEMLMQAVAAGDETALSDLYRRYAGSVYSLAYRTVKDREVAEELLNEAFVRVWRQAPHFDVQKGKFSTWLMSITRNLGIDVLRSQRARPQRAEGAATEDVPIDVPDERADVESDVWNAERRRIVRDALSLLPGAQRQALELAYFDGLTQVEISNLLGDPLGTTKTRMRLGIQKLREILSNDGLANELL